jgi:proline dehydrogenase
MNPTLRKLAVSPLMPLLRTAARSYVAGPELDDAVAVARSLAAGGAASTICFWDGPEDAPRKVAERYLDALRAIPPAGLNSYVSIKVPSLAFDAGLLEEVAAEARALNVRVHFDSLGPEAAGRTFDFIEDLVHLPTNLSCTIPGRWRRSVEDADRAVRLGIGVRVVKGQWEDAEKNGNGLDPRRGFLDVIDALAGRARHVAVATHNPELAFEAIGRLQAAGTPCELELLYGLPSSAALEVGRRLGTPVRFYIPYGHAWLPYGIRQATRNPRILWWMLRDAWASGARRRPATAIARS